jgi:hypothetical protein
MALPDPYDLNGTSFPGTPYPGQQFFLTATSGSNDPGSYIWNAEAGPAAWQPFIPGSIAPPGTS